MKSLSDSLKELTGHVMGEIGKLHDDNARWKDEIIREFRFSEENVRHQLLGANKDDIENLKIRVTRLERKTGLIR